MNLDLSLDFLRVVEPAAIACAHTMGQSDRHNSDQVAVEAMRRELDSVPIDGTVVIGEGERDEAPMLYIGEKVGMANRSQIAGGYTAVDIAVDPLEGTNLCATGAPNAIAVLAASSKGGLLHAPDLYMEKLIVGPNSKDVVDLDAPVKDNLGAITKTLGRPISDLVVIVLDRPRHEHLIEDIRSAGARIILIGDGDHRFQQDIPRQGSGVWGPRDLRRDGRHRRHPDEGGQILRRWHENRLTGDADGASPGSIHRQHSCRARGQRCEAAFLTGRLRESGV